MAMINQTQPLLTEPVLAVSHEQSYIPGLRDFHLLLIVPLCAYWFTGTFYFIIEKSGRFEKYRIHESEESLRRNKVTLREVFRSVISQQIIQTVFALCLDYAMASGQPAGTPPMSRSNAQQLVYLRNNIRRVSAVFGLDSQRLGSKLDHSISGMDGVQFAGSEMLLANIVLWVGIPAVQFAGAVIFLDFWQYLTHRVFHENKFLYKNVHSYHHRISVPYAYGALYNTLTEAFVGDTIGTTLTVWLTGLSERQTMWFVSLSLIKAVHDHGGYEFPYDPLDMITKNNTAYHDIHHQNWGMKYNFSQVYLTLWDDLLGTAMPPERVAEGYAAEKARSKSKKL